MQFPFLKGFLIGKAAGLFLKNISQASGKGALFGDYFQCGLKENLCYLPLMVNELLWTFTAQTVHQLSIIPSIAANKLAQ